MTDDSASSQRRPLSGWLAWAGLTLAVALAAPLMAWLARGRYGDNGIAAVVVAAVVCWGSASLAMFATLLMNRRSHAVPGVLLGMLIRMSLPLVAGMVLSAQVPWLAEGRLLGQVVVLYLITLAVETALVVKIVSAAPARAGIL